MGLNTNLLIFQNISEENYYEKGKSILEKLKFKIVEEKFDVKNKGYILNPPDDSIGITFSKNSLIFEDSCSKFLSFTKPCELQKMSLENTIFVVLISETTEITSYQIYKNGKCFDLVFGMEDWDLSFSDEIEEENIEEKVESCLKKDEFLKTELNQFIDAFNYDIINEQQYNLVKIIDLESIN